MYTGLTYEQMEDLYETLMEESDNTYWESAFRVCVGRWGLDEGLTEYALYRWGDNLYNVALDFGVIEPEEE